MNEVLVEVKDICPQECFLCLALRRPTWIFVRRVSMEDNPSGNRKGDGNPGGRGCPWPVSESLSRLSLVVGVESGVSSVCD